MKVPIKIHLVNRFSKVPIKAHEDDAAYDLFFYDDIKLSCGERAILDLNFRLEIPKGWKVEIYSRSGLAAKNGIFVLNSPGKIDCTYRDNIKVIICNNGYDSFNWNYNSDGPIKIAQMEVNPVHEIEFIETDELSRSYRTGGLGSTGLT